MKRKSISKRKLAPRVSPPECFCCGASSPWVTVTLPQESSCRGERHEVVAEVTQCRHCDAIITDQAQDQTLLEKTKLAHADWIAQTLKTVRRRLKLSQRDFAAELEISTATLSRALKGESLIDPSTESLLFIKIRGLEKAHDINALLKLRMKRVPSATEASSDTGFPSIPSAEHNGIPLFV